MTKHTVGPVEILAKHLVREVSNNQFTLEDYHASRDTAREIDARLSAIRELVKAGERLLDMCQSYHDETGHEIEGASMFGKCDDICRAMPALRSALDKIKEVKQ